MPQEEAAETALRVCSLAASSPTSAGKLLEAARPQALPLPPLAWPECLAQPFHVLRDCQQSCLAVAQSYPAWRTTLAFRGADKEGPI